jgi:hypothetical protein
MTKDAFVDAHRHEIGGWLLDAATSGRTGGQLAASVRLYMKKIDLRLSSMYDQLVPPSPVKPEEKKK